jgi:RNA polymerase sigma-70 factor (ECF subfamily)
MAGLTADRPLAMATIGSALVERNAVRETRPVVAVRVDEVPLPASPSDECCLIQRLRNGEETAFVALLEAHGPLLRRLARTYASESVAEDVVQETWIAVLRGLDGFAGRASLRTWIIGILKNVARRRAQRDRQYVPLGTIGDRIGQEEPSVDPDRFRSDGEWSGHWISYPRRWDEQPEERFLSSEGVDIAIEAIRALPPVQREVISLRDLEGWSSDEVSEALSISRGNQRVLLHRGRSRVRAALELAMGGAGRHGPNAATSNGTFCELHPDLERYYDRATDRAGANAHLMICGGCRTWLDEIHDRLRDLRCSEFVELVTEYSDDSVDDPMRARIDDHQRLCEGCRSYLDQMRSTVTTLGRIPPLPEPSEAVQAGLLAAFRAWPRSQDPAPEE